MPLVVSNMGSWPISRVLSRTIIRLGQQLLTGSSNLPGSNAGRAVRNPIWSCSGWSLPCRILLPATRCALTAPFHPYRSIHITRMHLGGLLSAALVVGSRRPDVIWHPALWSPDFPPPTKRKRKRAAIVWPTPLRILLIFKIRHKNGFQ